MDLSGLNEKQKQAVLQTEGQVLVLAGAGSGKTTVLVNRLAYILEKKNVRPGNILAITFTNKAAKEMKDRIEAKIGPIAKDMWISTFHSSCVRILRSCIEYAGYDSSFNIYDTSDTKTVVKECMKELNIDEKMYPIRVLQNEISKSKDNLVDVDSYEKMAQGDHRKLTISKVYSLYQEKLKKNNALDFDDLIYLTVEIFIKNPDILQKYSEKFKYIMVDEYQDTNNAQYMLINLLAKKNGNICVVGDDDQSIYKFRGANIQNILNFEKDYPNAQVIKLEQNYRSTSVILNAANAVIANNKERKGKDLWTQKKGGEPILSYLADNEHKEALFIAEEISKRAKSGESFNDFAILYRTNAQSRVIEEMLLRRGVPYRILAGLRFYDRKEIKDIIAYLRIIQNPSDDISLKRIINEPKRGIGVSSIEKAQNLANTENKNLYDIVAFANEYPELSRQAAKMIDFTTMISHLKKSIPNMSLSDFVMKVIRESGYMAMLELENTIEAKTRIENLNEFVGAVIDYERESQAPSLTDFLESVALISDIDAYDEDQDSVVLMTVHSAKGLEFPVVFLTGLEDGLFPSLKSADDEDIEEERRLCYVALTRAKDFLYITQASSRTLFGRTTYQMPSRFYKEIPTQYIKDISPIATVAQKKVDNFFSSIKKTKLPDFSFAPSSKKPTPTSSFNKGDKVSHPKFGEGVILSVTPFECDALLEIKFDSFGNKRLMAAYAKLKKI